jgi:hypothetical protein
MNFILNVVCNMQYKFDKARAFKSIHGTAGGVDLMIVDILEGLPVPMVSFPSISIPVWRVISWYGGVKLLSHSCTFANFHTLAIS